MAFSGNGNSIQSQFWLIVLLCSLVVSTGCDSSSISPSVKLTLPPASTDNSSSVNDDITVAEAEAFAEAWVSYIDGTGNGKAAKGLVSWVGIAERAFKPFKVSAKFRRGLIEGATKDSGAAFVNEIRRFVENGATYQLVKVISRRGKRHVVFRLYDEGLGLNYHDFQLERANGRVRASHLYIALTGEELAETLRNLMAPAIISSNSLLGKLTGEQELQMKTMEDLKKMKESTTAGNNAEALRIYDSLPSKTQNMKLVLLSKMSNLDIDKDEAAYLETIEKYSKLYPKDPSLGLVTMDAAYIRKDLALIEKSRKLIQAWTGGDPFLDLLVGMLLADLGEVDKGVELTKDIDPSPLRFAAAHDYKMTIALAANDYPTVVKELGVLRQSFGYEFGDFKGVEGFEGFVDSPEYTEWIAE